MFTDRGITDEALENFYTVLLAIALSHAEHLLDVVLEHGRAVVRLVREGNLAVRLDEVLMEVPRDVLLQQHGRASVRFAHPRPGGIGVRAVHVNLLRNREGDVVLRLELDDLGGRARLLVSELVARISDDLEALVLVFSVDLN